MKERYDSMVLFLNQNIRVVPEEVLSLKGAKGC